MNTFDLRALIFDMDGVLVDSEPLHFEAFKQFFASHSIDYTLEENAKYLGQKDIEIAHILKDKYKLEMSPLQLVDSKEEIFRELIQSKAVAIAGVVETLETARELGIKTAVASSATMPSIELIVNTLQLKHLFHHLSSGDEVKHGKPAPDVFLLAAERMQIEPSHCLVIEDTEAGVEAARKAGMRVIAIPCDATRHQSHDLADMRLESLFDLRLSDWVRN